MNPLEIEVKHFLPDIKSIRKSILDTGAECVGEYLETNFRYEDSGKNLIRKKSLLRLRKDSKTTLTFKSPPPEEPNKKDNHFKIHRELEVEINDFTTMALILESIGFHKEQIYEKKRETFYYNKTTLCLDTMPFGDFLEIEGQKININEMENRLGLKPEKRILSNYLEIFKHVRKAFNLSFSDVTFQNFEPVKIDISTFIRRFEIEYSCHHL